MERRTIITIEELKKISSEYHYESFDAETGILELDLPYEEEERWSHFDYRVEYQLSGEALSFAQEEERECQERIKEYLCALDSFCSGLPERKEEIETSSNEEDVTEEDVTEEDVTEEESESLHLPCGGVFKGDFSAPTKNQVKAANREWRRRKSTGRFVDDGSRWN